MKAQVILGLTLILFCGFATLTAINYNIVYWDTAVYVGMGKYVWSGGESGFWESYRAPVLPLLHGFLWQFDQTLFSPIALSILFSLGVLILTFLLGKKLFSSQIAVLATIFVATSFTFLFFSHHAITEIPSTFFLLLGLLLFFNKHYVWSGVILGISAQTRFFQLFTIAAFGLVYLLLYKRKAIDHLLRMGVGFVLVHIPFFIANTIMYSNPLYPYFLQLEFAQSTAFVEHQSALFYVVELFKENFLIVLLPFLFFSKIRTNQKLIGLTLLIPLTIYHIATHKEMRILLPLLPFIALFIAQAVVVAKQKVCMSRLISVSLLSIWLIVTLLPLWSLATTPVQETRNHIELYQHRIDYASGNIWISNPLYALYSDKRIDGLLYYFDQQGQADVVFYSSCDLEGNSPEYEKETKQTVYRVTQSLRVRYHENLDNCQNIIFS